MLWSVGMWLLGLSAGVLSGLFGIGGGILVIPVLVYVFGMGQKMAQGTTLLLMLPPIGLFAAMEYMKRGQANWQAAIWICLGFLIGGLLGAKVVTAIPPVLLKRAFGVLTVVVGLKMLLKP